jgi:UDP-2,3-diacylglucosamine hydrolase
LIKETREAEEDVKPDYQNARLAKFCREKLTKAGHIDYFIFGHWHVANIEPIARGSYYIHLGDWITRFTYGVFDGKEFKLKTFEGNLCASELCKVV